MTLPLSENSVILICPTLVPISAFAPTQNSYGAPIKSGRPLSAAEIKTTSFHNTQFYLDSTYHVFQPFSLLL